MRSHYPHLVMARPWRRELCAPAPLLTPLTLQCHPCGSTPLLSGVWPFLGTQNSRFSKARNNFHALPTQLFSSINMADTPSSLGTLLSGCFWPPSLSSCYNRSPSSSTTRLSSACSISTGVSPDLVLGYLFFLLYSLPRQSHIPATLITDAQNVPYIILLLRFLF